MGIFDRLVTVLKSNINDLISKAEDPTKMLEQLIMDMREQLAEAKSEVAGSIADEKKLQKGYLQAKKEAESWESKSMLAVQKNDDSLAMEAIKRQESAFSLAQQYEQQWLSQKEAVDKLKMALSQMNDKIQEAQRKKNLLIARQKRAEAQSKITKTMASLSDSSAFDTFSRMENKVDSIEARSEAEVEIQNELSGKSLDDKFKSLEMDSNVQDKLAALKAKMGPPK